jgi:PLP dependent protein
MKERIETILADIEEIRRKHSIMHPVTLVAVSKTHPLEKIRAAHAAGQRIFGESRIQEAREKIPELDDLDITWHLVGHLQTNKAKYAAKLFDVIESVDSLRLAEELDKRCRGLDKIMDVFLQVNTSGEEQKFGVDPTDLASLIQSLIKMDHIRITGLMTIGPLVDDEQQIRQAFKKLAQLRDSIKGKFPSLSLEYLSMGMSSDYRIAIEEGATHVRIGTALFGERIPD